MNELEFSYEDYLHNLTRSCEKIDHFNSTATLSSNLDDNCLDQAPSIMFNKFINDEDEDEKLIETNLNLSNSLSNTISSTISSSPNGSTAIDSNNLISGNNNNNLINDQKLNLTKQLQKAKLTNVISKNTTGQAINKTTPTKVLIKKNKKVGVNHKFVNNPKHLKKNKQSDGLVHGLMNAQFQLKLLKNTTDKSDPSKPIKNFSSTTSSSSKGMGCGKPGYITCSICNATKYYSHVQRRFGQFSCEPCSKFMKRFLKDPKVYYCNSNGECQIGNLSGEQEPRGVSVARCKACWLKICLDKFKVDDETKFVIDSHYMPRMQKLSSLNLNETRLNDELNSTYSLPPLPLLNTRKRKTNDDALIEKFNDDKISNRTDLKSNKRKNKDLNEEQTKSDLKRERKRKLIYSPPSTPKRTKKRLKLVDQLKDDNQTDLINEFNESTNKQNKLIKFELNNNLSIQSYGSKDLDEFSVSSDSFLPNIRSNQQFVSSTSLNSELSSVCLNKTAEISCSLGSDNQLNKESTDCGDCTHCLGGKNLNSLAVQKTGNKKLNDFSSEDCIVDNCSELSYEFTNGKITEEDDFLKDSFYDYEFSTKASTEEDLGLKYMAKSYEKSTSSKKETKFKNTTKKNKKRKDLLTSSNLMKKSLMKKNSFSYIFDADSSVIYEVLNANSPFL